MARYPDFCTPEGIQRRFAEGRGQGVGATYRPYFTRFDVRSRGERRETFSAKCGRSIHLLSRLEYHLFLTAEFDPNVIEIREQFPLPPEETRALAQELGIRHPRYWRTKCDVVMTTDFILTRRGSNGTMFSEAWSGKYLDSLRSWRTVEKQFLEREWHLRAGHKWFLKTEHDVPEPYVSNLRWLHPLQRRDAVLGYSSDLVRTVEETMRRLLADADGLLWQVALRCDHLLGFEAHPVSLYLCRYFLATQQWRTDLRTWNRANQPLLLLQ